MDGKHKNFWLPLLQSILTFYVKYLESVKTLLFQTLITIISYLKLTVSSTNGNDGWHGLDLSCQRDRDQSQIRCLNNYDGIDPYKTYY